MTAYYCKKCGDELTTENCYKGWLKTSKYLCKICDRKRKREQNLALKLETLSNYGNKCVCCQEDKIEFLSIDHIAGNGAEHRKSLGLFDVAGHNFYRWLKINNFPKDNYQILCFNCNYAKHVYGVCPHRNS